MIKKLLNKVKSSFRKKVSLADLKKKNPKLKVMINSISQKKQIVIPFFVGCFLVLIPIVYLLFKQPKIVEAALIKMDEGYGSTVNDNGGNISGTLTGASWQTNDLCYNEKCLYFDGSSNIDFGDDSDLDYTGSEDFTIVGWFRHGPVSGSSDYIVAKHESGTAGGYKVWMDSDGDVAFGIDDDGTWDTIDIVGDDQNGNYDDSSWHHFAAVKNGITGIYLYIDARLVDSDESLTETGSLVNAANFYMGVDADGSSNGWAGFLDEIKVYNTARTADEVKTDFLGSTTDRGTAVEFGSNQSGFSNGLIGYWKMDDNVTGNGQTISDNSGLGNDLVTSDSESTLDCTSMGKFGRSCNFEGTNDYLTGNSSTTPTFVNALEVSSWGSSSSPKSTSSFDVQTGDILVAYAMVENGSFNDVTIAGGSLSWTQQEKIDNGMSYIWNAAWTATADSDKSMNVTFTKAGGGYYGGGVVVFRNSSGVGATDQNDNGTGSGAPSLSFATTSDNSAIVVANGDWNAVSGSRTWRETAGTLTETSYFGDDATYAVHAGYHADAGPTDTYTLGLTSPSNQRYGIIGIEVKGGSVATSIGDVKSISFWAKPDSITESVFDFNGTQNIAISSGTIQCNNCTNQKIFVDGVETTSFPDTNWHHVVVTTDTAIDASAFLIGNEGSNYYDGSLDEVRIYNRQLDPSEISAIYSWVPGPTAYYSFDEGSGTSTIYDHSTNENHLTMKNMTTDVWTNGKFGKSVKFDGNNDYATRTYDSSFDTGTEDFTVNGWFKKPPASASVGSLAEYGVLNYTGFEFGDSSPSNGNGDIDVYEWQREGGGSFSAINAQTATKRSGEYGLKYLENGTFNGENLLLRNADRSYLGITSGQDLWLTFYLKLETSLDGDYEIASFWDTDFYNIALFLDGSDNLCVEAGSTSSTISLTQGQWHKIEIHGVSDGTATLYVDDGTGVTANTFAGNFDLVSIGPSGSASAGEFYIDDVVISTEELDFDPQIVRMDVESDGNSTDWDATNGYQEVDDIPQDSDSTYITSSTSGNTQLFNLESTDTAGVSGNIKGIKTQALVRDEGGSSNIATVVRTSNTDFDQGEDVDPGSSYNSIGTVLNVNPSSDTPWSTSALDSLQIGVINNASVATRVSAVSAMVLTDGTVESNQILNYTGFEGGPFGTGTNGDIDFSEIYSTGNNYEIATNQVRSGEYSFERTDTFSYDDEYLLLRNPDGSNFNRSGVVTWLTFYFYLVDSDAGQTIAQINLGSNWHAAIQINIDDSNNMYLLETDEFTQSSDVPISTGSWHKIEIEYDDINEVATLHLDGTETVTHDLNTSVGTTSTFNEVVIGGYDPTNVGEYYIDDMVVSSDRLDFEPQIVRMDVNGDGNSTDWDATNGYQEVDDVPSDGDTTYITSSTSGNKQLVDLESSAEAGVVGAVKGVKTQVLARDTGGSSNMASLVRINGTNFDQGEDIDPGTGYHSIGTVMQTNPATGTVWNSSQLDQLQVGVLNNASVASRATALDAMVLSDGTAGAGSVIENYIVSRYDGDQGFKIWTDGNGILNFGIDDDIGWDPDDITSTSVSYDDNHWHFFSANKTSSGIYLTVDGTQATPDETLSATGTLTSDSAPFSLGSDEPSNGYFWDGELDDIRFYNYNRTAAQITSDMNAGHPSPGSPVGSEALYLKMDEGYGSTAHDSGPNQLDATLSSTSIWSTSGKRNNGIDFDQVNGSYLSISDNSTLSITGDVTLSAWINPSETTAATLYPIAGKWEENSSIGSYLLALYGDELRMYIDSSSNYETTDSVNFQTGTWYHVMGSYDSSAQTVDLFVNGTVRDSTTTGTIPSSIGDDTDSFNVGADSSSGSIEVEHVPANTSDGEELNNSSWLSSGYSNQLWIGYWNQDEEPGFRFTNVDVAYQANIISASLTVTSCGEDVSQDTDMVIYGDSDVSSPGAWGSSNRPSQVTTTTANTPFTVTDTSWPATDNTQEFDITDIIDEIINTSGWSSGESLRLVIYTTETSGTNDFCMYDFNDSGDNEAYISITYGSGSYFKGVVDEVKVYPAALTENQARVEQNFGVATVFGAKSTNSSGDADSSANSEYCPPGQGTACVGPIGEWDFDETSGTTVYDSSGNGNNGTLGGDGVGTDVPSWTRGKIGRALQFDGNNDYVALPAGSVASSLGDFTVEAWIYPIGNLNSHLNTVVGFGGASEEMAFGIATNQQVTVYSSDLSGSVGSDTGVDQGVWYHIVFVRDGADYKFYLNGDTAGAGTWSATTISFDGTARDLGGDSTQGEDFPGIVDQIKIYDYARDPGQVAWDFNRGKPAAWYKLDDNVTGNAQVIRDSSGKSNDGTTSDGDATLDCTVDGQRNTACSLDGSDDYISVTDPGSNSTFDFDTGDAITVSAWVYPLSNNEYKTLVYKEGGSGETNYWFAIRDGTGSNIRQTFAFSTNSGGSWVDAHANYGTLKLNQWNHVAYTYTFGTYNINFYVNGVDVGVQDPLSSDAPDIGDNSLYISDSSGGSPFDGTIDEIKLYRYAMTAEQVKAEYNSGIVRFN